MPLLNEQSTCPCEEYEVLICEDCGEIIDNKKRTVAQESHGICECLFICNTCIKKCEEELKVFLST